MIKEIQLDLIDQAVEVERIKCHAPGAKVLPTE